MSKSEIAWCQHTWNPIVGCSIPTLPSTGKPRAGCKNCYASKDAPHRFKKLYERDGVITIRGKAKREGLTFVPRTPAGKSLGKGAQWTGEIRCLPWQLEVPLRRKTPTVYFVNSLSDMFHESLVDCEEGRRFIAAIFGVMAACPQHTFQILTKRPHKAREWFEWLARADFGVEAVNPSRQPAANCRVEAEHRLREGASDRTWSALTGDVTPAWPLPQVWIGASVEDQASADWAIPELLDVPAAVRFLSAEPLLGPITFAPIPSGDGIYTHTDPLTGSGIGWDVELALSEPNYDYGGRGEFVSLDWIICGGESGPKARAMHPDWARSLRDQCEASGTAFFFKQWGAWTFEQTPTRRSGGGPPPDMFGAPDEILWMTVASSTNSKRVGERIPYILCGDFARRGWRVGVNKTGRLLDGREWNELPT